MKNKPIVIAGNGPSLAQIDYRRLPADFDVFRCNQFYFEDKYFLGKKVTGAFLNPYPLAKQFYTYHLLQEKAEYDIQNIYYVSHTLHDEYEKGRRLAEDFPSVKNCSQYLQALPRFHAYERFLGFYHQKKFTSVIWMLITALAQGYKQIYLVGLDFYQGGSHDYAFNIYKPHLINAMPNFADKKFKDRNHNKETDVQGLKMALEMPGVTIYSLSKKSPVNEYLPLAPVVHDKLMQIEKKDPNAIMDLCELPPECSLGGGQEYDSFVALIFCQNIKNLKRQFLCA